MVFPVLYGVLYDSGPQATRLILFMIFVSALSTTVDLRGFKTF